MCHMSQKITWDQKKKARKHPGVGFVAVDWIGAQTGEFLSSIVVCPKVGPKATRPTILTTLPLCLGCSLSGKRERSQIKTFALTQRAADLHTALWKSWVGCCCEGQGGDGVDTVSPEPMGWQFWGLGSHPQTLRGYEIVGALYDSDNPPIFRETFLDRKGRQFSVSCRSQGARWNECKLCFKQMQQRRRPECLVRSQMSH